KDGGVTNKSWVFRYAIPEKRRNGRQKERQMGLGSLNTISIAEAREKALNCRKLRDQGIDPIEARRAERANAALEAARGMTFDQCRDAFIAAKQAGWRNVKHASQWRDFYQPCIWQSVHWGCRYSVGDESPAAVVDD